jgi:hypothetical protein
LFSLSNANKFITYPSFRKDYLRVDWLSILKTKPMGRVKVVKDENEDICMRDDVFQVSELVKSYQVAPLIDLEENSNFHIFDNSLVDAEELNVVLNSKGKAQINEDDDTNVIISQLASFTDYHFSPFVQFPNLPLLVFPKSFHTHTHNKLATN